MKFEVYRWVIALAAVLILNGCGDQRGAPATPTAQPADNSELQSALAERRVKEVASHFACPCGGCGHEELLDCRCDMPNGAVQAFAMIHKHLQEGNDVPKVIEFMAARFPQARHDSSEVDVMQSHPESSE